MKFFIPVPVPVSWRFKGEEVLETEENDDISSLGSETCPKRTNNHSFPVQLVPPSILSEPFSSFKLMIFTTTLERSSAFSDKNGDMRRWVFAHCALNVHRVCFACSLSFLRMSSKCSLSVPYVYSECSLSLLCMFSECALSILLD